MVRKPVHVSVCQLQIHQLKASVEKPDGTSQARRNGLGRDLTDFCDQAVVVNKLMLRSRQSEDLAEHGINDNILLLPAGPALLDVAQLVELRGLWSEGVVRPEGVYDVQHLGRLLAIEVQNVDRVNDRVAHEARCDI